MSYRYYKDNKINPTGFELKTQNQLDIHIAKRNNLYMNKLHIPNLVWRNSDVLEVGCSSGENALVQAMEGANLTFVEPVGFLIEKLKLLFNHWDVENSIKDIYIQPIEEFETEEKYDVVIAEGFIHNLETRDVQVRKLFNLLRKDGLMIISISNPIGNFIEYFKMFIARIYCEGDIEKSKLFFLDDYNKIPHSRSYEAWVEDLIFNPEFNSNNMYEFTSLIEDLGGLNPIYYSSWPDYRKTDIDYTWHKYIPNYRWYMDSILDSYSTHRLSFMLGKLIEDNSRIVDLIMECLKLMDDLSNVEKVKDKLGEIGSIEELKGIISEMKSVLDDLNPDTYRRCENLRRCWGVPHHYIVLRHE